MLHAGRLSIICASLAVLTLVRAATGVWAVSPNGYRLVEAGALTIATHGSSAPALVVTPNDEVVGLDGAWLTAFAKDHGLKLRLFNTTFASVILAVETGKVDVGTYYFYREERARHVYFTYPFLRQRGVVFTRRFFQYNGAWSLTGKRIGTGIGFIWAQYLQAAFGASLALFPSALTGLTALFNGYIDGWVDSDDTISGALGPPPEQLAMHLLRAGDFGIPENVITNYAYNFVRCDNSALAKALDDEMTILHRRGTWIRVLKANKLTEAHDVPLQEPPQFCSSK